MAMPKKGVRKIIVNDKEYKYIVKHHRTDCGVLPIELAKVTIESPDKRYYMDQEERTNITPAYVRQLIEKHLI